jgi:hypothetical protein
MQFSFDWKFLVIILVTLAGVIVPVWLWQADRQAKSLSSVIVSQTSLKPDISSNVDGIKIFVDNIPIDRPYLTVLKLSNNGSKPILTTDFEEPLEIQVDGDTTIVRSQITKSEPKDIQPKTTLDAKVIKIMPLLLNPNDNITFAVVTAGGSPKFTVRSRVAGIAAVAIEDNITKTVSPTKRLLNLLFGFTQLFVYVSCLSVLIEPRVYTLRNPTIVFASLAALNGGVSILKPILDEFTQSSIKFWILFMCSFLILYLINRYVNRRQSPVR